MGANHLFQLGHNISQRPLARVQPISKLRAYRHGFLIRSPGLSQEMHLFHEGSGRPTKPIHSLSICRQLGIGWVPLPFSLFHIGSLIWPLHFFGFWWPATGYKITKAGKA